MKIILVNIRYFVVGGPERYMFNITKLLESHGHEVFPFSIKHKLNIETPYQKYFLEPMGKGDEVFFNEYSKKSIKSFLQLFGRLFYSFEARKKLSALIKATKPDLVYILLYQNKISPSIIDAAKKFRLPVVIRISDFGMICAANTFYRTDRNIICEKCLTNGKRYLIRYNCFHGSLIFSTLKYFAFKLHNLLGSYKNVDAYVIPSQFTKQKFIQYGIEKRKIFHIPTFFNLNNYNIQNIEYGDFALYIGRIEPEKGIKTLIDAFIETAYPLIIIGSSSSDYMVKMQEYLIDKKHSVQFLGKASQKTIMQYLEKCRFTIVPSEWYDNLPNTILESFAFKKPVIGSNLGSITELVIDNETGYLFEPKNSSQLNEKITECFNNKAKVKILGENAYNKLYSDFSSTMHYDKLMEVFMSFTNKF